MALQRLSSELVKYKSYLTGSVERGLRNKLSDIVYVTDFGAKGDGVTDDSAAFQAAIDAAGFQGEVWIPPAKVDWVFKREVLIHTPICIRMIGGGSCVTTKQRNRIRVHGHLNAFKLVPSQDGYMFGYGITGVHLADLRIEGDDRTRHGFQAVCVDETVNNGIYHVRECLFERNKMRYMDYGFNLRGICYLNEWYSNRCLWCSTACHVDRVSGAADGASDQSRFFGNEFVLCDRALVLSTEGHHGSQTIIGNTLSEGKVGLLLGFNVQLCMMGNQVENNEWYGVNISIPANIQNPASEHSKLIVGNCFLSNVIDIVVAKDTTAFAGGFPFALKIDDNSFAQTKQKVLEVTAPTGPQEFDSSLFVLGRNNVFSKEGKPTVTIPPEMISEGWKGYRGYQEDGKVTISGLVSGGQSQVIGRIVIPYGKQCYIKYTLANMNKLVSAGYSATAGSILIVDATDPSNAVVLKDEFTSAGELFIPRVAANKVIVISSNSTDDSHVCASTVEYCIT